MKPTKPQSPVRRMMPDPGFLPMTRAEMQALGWDQVDILLVTGDAYVDHPSFGAALLGRWLAAHGYRVGIVAQPRWDRPDDFTVLGRPRLFAGVTAGALDSLLAHYTAFRKKRHDDAYTPGGLAGRRPNRACIVYTGLVRQAFPGLPVVLGGLEASLRRASHYDFWSDALRRSILLDSKADLLVYGMGERAVLEIAQRLAAHPEVVSGTDTVAARELLRGIPGTSYRAPADAVTELGAAVLPSHEEILADPGKLMTATLELERQVQAGGATVAQSAGGAWVFQAPPPAPVDLDRVYELPFTRQAHPAYGEPIPALEMIRFSVLTHRGCCGGCAFCSLALHQGRRIDSRSRQSILAEVERLCGHPDWRGSLSDVGGATANLWGARCAGQPETCRRTSCLAPAVCANLQVDQARLAQLLREIGRTKGVKNVRTASGVRHDLALLDPEYFAALVGEFTGGQLKVAPEHFSGRVLKLMRKPPFSRFEEFLDKFESVSRRVGREQYVIPYLISAFPGCEDKDMHELAAWLRKKNWRPQQVQCFIPLPGTVAGAMFYAGVDSELRPIPVARTDAERLRQHGILLPEREKDARTKGRPAAAESAPASTGHRAARRPSAAGPRRSHPGRRPQRS